MSWLLIFGSYHYALTTALDFVDATGPVETEYSSSISWTKSNCVTVCKTNARVTNHLRQVNVVSRWRFVVQEGVHARTFLNLLLQDIGNECLLVRSKHFPTRYYECMFLDTGTFHLQGNTYLLRRCDNANILCPGWSFQL